MWPQDIDQAQLMAPHPQAAEIGLSGLIKGGGHDDETVELGGWIWKESGE